jgi:hypothetical protein
MDGELQGKSIEEKDWNPMKLLARLTPIAALALPLSLAAATISGTVTNKTTNKPAAGDTAVLLDLTQSMQESARTTVDAQGHYSFTVPDNAGMHLVQVEHQKASYYGPVPPNTTTVNVDVYDVAPRVEGLHIYADVSRMETDQQGLSVTESYFIRNESKPPKTQLSAHSFEFYLPQDATLEGATATGPGGMAVASSPVPAGEKGHYAFVFPLRPGETRFQIGYRLPYSGSLGLKARVSLPADNVAVMLPKSMSFDGGKSFQALQGEASGPGTQTYLATNVGPAVPVAYTVSGTGSMPREQQGQSDQGQAQAGMTGPEQGATGAPDQSAQPNRPGGGLGNPIDTPDPLQKYKWWILSGLGLALVVAAGFMLRARPDQQPVAAAPVPSPLTPTVVPAGPRAAAAYRTATAAPAVSNGAAPKSALLAALKDELFSLETERLEGKLSEAEYAELKSALEVVLRRALAREPVTR